MAEIYERVYEIAKDAIAQQERHVADMRTRGVALLAAGGVIAGLLAEAAFRDGRPDGAVQWIAVVVGLVGAGALFAAVAVMLWPRDLAFTFKADDTYAELHAYHATTQPRLDLELAFTLADSYRVNGRAIRWVRWALWAAIAAIVVEAVGLAELPTDLVNG